jgi:hypothetical protein
MGGGRWDSSVYSSTTRSKIDSGTDFAYSTLTSSAPKSTWKAHESLDPSKFSVTIDGKGVRESRDSDEHPNSVAIGVVFDVTGSMGGIPKVIQKNLPNLLGLLLRKGYVDDPQIIFGAVGDAVSGDRVPLQMGQFESDNRMDDTLDNLFLEGGGGGGNHESYDLALYFMAHHTSIDCYEKRDKKGYLFVVVDEACYESTPKAIVNSVLGDTYLQEDLKLEDVVEQVKEKYETYILIATQSGYQETNVPFWRKYFGQNVILMSDGSEISELIGMTIGIAEGTVDLAEAEEDLKEIGTSDSKIKAVTKSLATVASGSGSVVASTTGDSPDLDGESGSERI